MFDYLSMKGNYEERKVACFEGDDFTVDTAAVTDSDQPYETGICHPKYNFGRWVIVEMYESKKEAKEGHDKWVSVMTSDDLPKELVDCGTSEIGKLASAFA